MGEDGDLFGFCETELWLCFMGHCHMLILLSQYFLFKLNPLFNCSGNMEKILKWRKVQVCVLRFLCRATTTQGEFLVKIFI